MFYTGKGDAGDTGLFGCNQRISKSSAISEALGTLDECNSYLGLAKVKLGEPALKLPDGSTYHELVHSIQEDIFIIQAEVGGTPMTIGEEKVKKLEEATNSIEKTLPPIHSFSVPGGSEASAILDIARTLARRAERRVVGVKDEGSREIGTHSLAYLNRLSSVLYAMARHANFILGIKENAPHYK